MLLECRVAVILQKLESERNRKYASVPKRCIFKWLASHIILRLLRLVYKKQNIKNSSTIKQGYSNSEVIICLVLNFSYQ